MLLLLFAVFSCPGATDPEPDPDPDPVGDSVGDSVVVTPEGLGSVGAIVGLGDGLGLGGLGGLVFFRSLWAHLAQSLNTGLPVK